MTDIRDDFPDARQPRTPVGDVAGRPTDEVAELYRADGFRVQVVEIDDDPVLTMDLRADRIRVFVRDGQVVRATQG